MLLVAWDRSSQPMHKASHAVLYIKDGPRQSHLDLDSQQLLAANVKYWPETPKVTFTLEVDQGDGNVSDSVQIAGVPASAIPARPAADGASANRAADASTEPDRPSPFASRTPREIRPDPSTSLALPVQPGLAITAAPTPPPSVGETPDQRSRLSRMVGKIPLLRRLTNHPQHSDNEHPPK